MLLPRFLVLCFWLWVLEGNAYQALGISSTRLHELAKAIAFGDESTLVKEMSDQSKFLQGDKSEFLGNKQ